jgi:MFS family permease
VVWYTGQFYALFYLEKILKVEGATANILIAVALAIGTPFFIFFGWLSDKIGRKLIILSGCALAALSYFPLFHALTEAANPALAHAQTRAPVVLMINPERCSVQFDPIGKNKFDSTSCDVVKSWLAKAGVPYDTGHWADSGPMPDMVRVKVGDRTLPVFDSAKLADPASRAETVKQFQATLKEAIDTAGYPAKADPAQTNTPLVIAILVALVLLVTMVYGPIAAMLVELFPSRIRYTSMSLPYHIGNGWFGGFLPTVAFAMVAATGNIYYGLWYPVVVAVLTLIVGLLFLPETFRNKIDD